MPLSARGLRPAARALLSLAATAQTMNFQCAMIPVDRPRDQRAGPKFPGRGVPNVGGWRRSSSGADERVSPGSAIHPADDLLAELAALHFAGALHQAGEVVGHVPARDRSEEHTSELQSLRHLV